MLTSYVQLRNPPARRVEPTIFEQVYGGYRRRPATVSLNVQWVPTVERSKTSRWSGTDIDNRNLKTETYFETNRIREIRAPKAVTPPSSDYTDAYLSAFAPKPIPTRHIRRITSPIFVNVVPIPFLSTRTNFSPNSSIKTSETRFNYINNTPISNSFEPSIPPFPSSYSTYSSRVIPDIPTHQQTFSNSPISSSVTRTDNSNYPTSFHEERSHRAESIYENASKPIPPSSLPSYSPPSTNSLPSTITPTYKPSVSFQSVPIPFLHEISQHQNDKQTLLSSSNTEKQIDRPNTLLFQPDEDIRSSSLEKSSPTITPSVESPTTRIDSKLEPEQPPIDELSAASSKPIEIMEKTIGKYDSVINQISDILASVSPLSSTMSSMSPGKSILDYELTADGSPILQRKQIEPQPTVIAKNTPVQRVKTRHLIREDSYDKLVNAIADLDNELTPPPLDIQMKTTIIEEEKDESMTTSLNEAEPQASSSSEQRDVEAPVISNELSPTNVEHLDEEKIVDIPTVMETSLENPNFIQEQADLLANIPSDEATQEETSESYDEVTSDKKNEKHVSWGENISSNEEEEESVSYQSPTEESSLSEGLSLTSAKKHLTTDELATIDQPQILSESPISSSSQSEDRVISQTCNAEQNYQIEPVEESILRYDDTNTIEPKTKTLHRQIKSVSSMETSSSFSDSVDRQTPSSDLRESRSSHDEPISSARSSADVQFVAPIDLSIKNNLTVDEQWTTISNVTSRESVYDQETVKQSTETLTPVIDQTEHDVETNILSLPPPIIVSPIDTLPDTISTRYISSDVYHSYLGEHQQFLDNAPEGEGEKTKEFLLASLRQTITASATPLIETIQSVVSSMQTMKAAQPLTNKSEIIDISQDKTDTITSASIDSEKENTKQHAPLEEESKTILESVPGTATESMQTISSDLSANKQETLSVPPVEQDGLTQEETASPINEKSLTERKTSDTDLTTTIDHVNNQNNIMTDSLSSGTSTLVSTDDKTIDYTTPNTESTPDITDTELTATEIPENTSIIEKSTDLTLVENNPSIPIVPADEQISSSNEFTTKQLDMAEKEETIQIELTSNETGEVINSTQNINEISTFTSPPEEEKLPSVKEDNDITEEQTTSIEPILDQTSLSQENQTAFILHPDDQLQSIALQQEPIISDNNDEEIIRNIILKLIDDITQDILSQWQQNSTQTNQRQQLTIDFEHDSLSPKPEIEKTSSKSPIILRESSPTNTEPDSLELMHALRGHSIVQHNSSERISPRPEKSSSSTTSSQVTSSDRYVSYAIHEMGDSSQERLPAIPIAADIPIYKTIEENPPAYNPNQTTTKEDDLTEFDATDNLTSYSDDILLQRVYPSAENRENYFETSSTDDDVDDEFEQHDLTDIQRIIEKLAQPNSILTTNEEPYQRFDLATTPSSNDSSSSARRQADDVYLIPGYPGLWRPSAENDSINLAKDYEVDDDEKQAIIKSRTIVPTINSSKRPLVFGQHDRTTSSTPSAPVRPTTIDLSNPSRNDFPYDQSESDSYQTCPSSISKQANQLESSKSRTQDQTSSDENIYLIHERERGVSLPVTMKIDYDDIGMRLSASTPIGSHLYSKLRDELSSPSTQSEPPLSAETDSNSRGSLLSINNQDNEQPRTPSWLNKVNTVTSEISSGPTESRTTLLKTAKGPIGICSCDPEGNSITIENTSQSKNIALTNWILRQENDNGDELIFTFPDNYLLTSNHSIQIFTKPNESEQKSDDLIASSLSSWFTDPNIITTLINPEGKTRATLTKKTIFS